VTSPSVRTGDGKKGEVLTTASNAARRPAIRQAAAEYFLSLSTFEQTDNGGQATIGSMQSPMKTGLSVGKVSEAEAELLAHVQSGSRNPHQQRQLAKAV
jgi:hypothetical protein